MLHALGTVIAGLLGKICEAFNIGAGGINVLIHREIEADGHIRIAVRGHIAARFLFLLQIVKEEICVIAGYGTVFVKIRRKKVKRLPVGFTGQIIENRLCILIGRHAVLIHIVRIDVNTARNPGITCLASG